MKKVQMDPYNIINRDQMPIQYLLHIGYWKKWTKTHHIWLSISDTKHATLAATISTNRKLLLPMLIFVGKMDGCIAKSELQIFRTVCFYASQSRCGWMRKWWTYGLTWFLFHGKHKESRYCALACPGCLWYSHDEINCELDPGLRIEVQHNHGGCTYLCQPVDVEVNHPIKKEMMDQQEDWMFDGGRGVGGVAKSPQYKVGCWVNYHGMQRIYEEPGKNVWRKMGYGLISN